MKRLLGVLLALLLLLPATAGADPEQQGRGDGRAPGLEGDLYETEVDVETERELRAEGLDVAVAHAAEDGRRTLQMVLSGDQVEELEKRGLALGRVRNERGQDNDVAAFLEAENGFEVWRSWSEDGGIADEMEWLAEAYDATTQLITIGQSLQGQDIYAMRVTRDADRVKEGARPAVLYLSNHHAREWITVEFTRRLLRHFLENDGTDDQVTRLIDTTELWFVLSGNPDGYDYTFTEGNRLHRKNMRDTDGDPATFSVFEGVDLNRNFPTRWGYDNEGSSPLRNSFTYRGEGPASEPETQATIDLFDRVDFSFFVNYHSAAELLLYGTGWQIDTPLPDDLISIALAGTDENPAVEGFDPDLSAELYTTNGTATGHSGPGHGIIGHTPELATCQTATTYIDDDEYGPSYCRDEGRSVFEFPDDEELVQFEFEKNLDYALAMAESADDPDDPVSPVGIEAPDFAVDEFSVSHGDPQTVAVWTKQAFKGHTAHWTVNGGPEQSTPMTLWEGGERYGGEDLHYGEYRAQVTGFAPGDTVEVWFSAQATGNPGEAVRGTRGAKNDNVEQAGRRTSEPFSFTASDQRDGDVLLVTDNSPGTPLGGEASLAYAPYYEEALADNGRTMDTYEVGATGPAPHDHGVLGHYDMVIWHTGDKLVTDYQGGLDTTLLAHEVNMRMRDYLNDGGRILASGKNHGFEEFFPLPYGTNGAPDEVCHGGDCLLLSNDTYQYYFGGFSRIRRGGLDASGNALDVRGVAGPLEGYTFGLDGGDSANNQGSSDGTNTTGTGTATWVTTSSQLPVDAFPQFASSRAAAWEVGGAGAPYEPVTGDWQVATGHDDQSYKRLTTTVDLTGAANGEVTFKASYRIEANWDYFFVEARPVGTDDWTTLPDANGHTGRGTGQSCPSGWQAQLHPQLFAYQDPACNPTGTTGEWHAATGSSDGVEEWAIDLSAYAGQEVEVHLTYATDWATGDLGVFVDDATVVVDGTTVSETSFETDLGDGVVSGAPEDSVQANPNDWDRVGITVELASVVTTEDTVLLGFGFEGISTSGERAEVMRRVLEHLG